MEHELFTINEYGTVELKLKELMDARGITRNALARICFVLDCTPGDIIQHVMNKQE